MGVFKADILQGRVALVTSGGTGIGRKITRTLGRHGAAVVIASRKGEVIEAAREELEKDGIRCLGLTCDVRDEQAVEAVIDRAVAELGGLHIVVNNAAGNFPATIEGLSYNGFRTIVDIDLQSTYNVTRAAYTRWLNDNGGVVVNIAAPFEQWGESFQAHWKNGVRHEVHLPASQMVNK